MSTRPPLNADPEQILLHIRYEIGTLIEGGKSEALEMSDIVNALEQLQKFLDDRNRPARDLFSYPD